MRRNSPSGRGCLKKRPRGAVITFNKPTKARRDGRLYFKDRCLWLIIVWLQSYGLSERRKIKSFVGSRCGKRSLEHIAIFGVMRPAFEVERDKRCIRECSRGVQRVV